MMSVDGLLGELTKGRESSKYFSPISSVHQMFEILLDIRSR